MSGFQKMLGFQLVSLRRNASNVRHIKVGFSNIPWTFFDYLSITLNLFTLNPPCTIQWRSEYWTSLVFEWSKVVRLPNGPLCECHLNTGINFVRYSDCHLKTRPVFRWWSEYQNTIWIPNKWIRDKWKFAIQMFPLFRCLLFRSLGYFNVKLIPTCKRIKGWFVFFCSVHKYYIW